MTSIGMTSQVLTNIFLTSNNVEILNKNTKGDSEGWQVVVGPTHPLSSHKRMVESSVGARSPPFMFNNVVVGKNTLENDLM
jgi:hypothetical protein